MRCYVDNNLSLSQMRRILNEPGSLVILKFPQNAWVRKVRNAKKFLCTYQPRSAPPDRNDVSELRTQSQLPATLFAGSVLLRTNFDSPAVKHWKSSVSGSSGI